MKLDSADRKILLVAFSILLVCLVISATVNPSAEDSLPYPSPYSASSGGAKAAYTLLSQIGYRTEHWRKPPSKLMEHGINTVLLVAVPTQNPTPEDHQELRRYVERGGKLIAIGSSTAALLPRSAFFPGLPHFAWRTYRALIPSGLTSNAPEIAMAPAVYWQRNDEASHIQYGESREAVVISYKYGKGEVIWWAAADPLTNSGILQKNNLQLFLNSVGPAGARTVLWDDYFHEGEVTLADSLLSSPLKWSLLQLGLLALFVVLTYSRRHGPVRPLPQKSRLATLEFVETLGALYQRVGATELPVQVAYERFRHLLHRKLGISTSASPQQVADRLRSRIGERVADLEQNLAACESARYQPEIGEEEALRLVKWLENLSHELKIMSKDESSK